MLKAEGSFGPAVQFGGVTANKPAVAFDPEGRAHLLWIDGNDLFYTTIGP